MLVAVRLAQCLKGIAGRLWFRAAGASKGRGVAACGSLRREPPSPDRPCLGPGRLHFSAVCTEPRVAVRFVPTPCTTAMIATAMPAAMRPYSIAVAPVSLRRKRMNCVIYELPHLVHSPVNGGG